MSEEQAVTIANISLVLSPNGKDAICSFNLLGAMAINMVIPEAVVRAFIEQWKNARKEEVQILQLTRGKNLHV